MPGRNHSKPQGKKVLFVTLSRSFVVLPLMCGPPGIDFYVFVRCGQISFSPWIFTWPSGKYWEDCLFPLSCGCSLVVVRRWMCLFLESVLFHCSNWLSLPPHHVVLITRDLINLDFWEYFSLGFPTTDPDTKIQMQVVYLWCDSWKRQQRSGEEK